MCHRQILYLGCFSENEAREDHVMSSRMLRKQESASAYNRNKDGTSGHPYRTDQDIRKKGPLSPASETQLVSFL